MSKYDNLSVGMVGNNPGIFNEDRKVIAVIYNCGVHSEEVAHVMSKAFVMKDIIKDFSGIQKLLQENKIPVPQDGIETSERSMVPPAGILANAQTEEKKPSQPITPETAV